MGITVQMLYRIYAIRGGRCKHRKRGRMNAEMENVNDVWGKKKVGTGIDKRQVVVNRLRPNRNRIV